MMPPPRTTRESPDCGPTGSVWASYGYGPYQSRTHSIASECMFFTPQAFASPLLGGRSPLENRPVVPARATNSHSASVGSRYVRLSMRLSQAQNCAASFQLTPVTYGVNLPASW